MKNSKKNSLFVLTTGTCWFAGCVGKFITWIPKRVNKCIINFWQRQWYNQFHWLINHHLVKIQCLIVTINFIDLWNITLAFIHIIFNKFHQIIVHKSDRIPSQLCMYFWQYQPQSLFFYIYHGVIQVCLQSFESFTKCYKFWTLVYPATLPWGSCTGLLLASTSTNEVCPFTVTWFRNNICGTPTAGVIWALVLTWGEPCTIRLLGCCTMFEVCTIWPAPDAMGVACETLVKFCKLDRVPSAT